VLAKFWLENLNPKSEGLCGKCRHRLEEINNIDLKEIGLRIQLV
jgi:hypothetical protein